MRGVSLVLFGLGVLGGAFAQQPTECPAEKQDGDGPRLRQENMKGRKGVERYISEELWEIMFSSRSMVPQCEAGRAFFTYEGFVQASKAFPDFANSGDWDTDVREIAAFLATCSQETTGAFTVNQHCGLQSYGGCFPAENPCGSPDVPCFHYGTKNDDCEKKVGGSCGPVPGQAYYGRGPIQLSYNYNYAFFSHDFLGDASILVNDPNLVFRCCPSCRNQTLFWGSGFWFWLTPQGHKPSCHDAMTGKIDYGAEKIGAEGGFGLTTNIINGGVECRPGTCTEVDKSVKRQKNFIRNAFLMGVPTCLKAYHSLDCKGTPDFPYDDKTFPKSPCTIADFPHEECGRSNKEECPALDGSTVTPPVLNPCGCDWRGNTELAFQPKRRFREGCELPLLPNGPHDPALNIPEILAAQGSCMETYDPESPDVGGGSVKFDTSLLVPLVALVLAIAIS